MVSQSVESRKLLSRGFSGYHVDSLICIFCKSKTYKEYTRKKRKIPQNPHRIFRSYSYSYSYEQRYR